MYDSFDLDITRPEEGQKGCTYLTLTAAPDADEYEKESVVFVNDCGDELETLIVNVQVFDNSNDGI